MIKTNYTVKKIRGSYTVLDGNNKIFSHGCLTESDAMHSIWLEDEDVLKSLSDDSTEYQAKVWFSVIDGEVYKDLQIIEAEVA